MSTPAYLPTPDDDLVEAIALTRHTVARALGQEARISTTWQNPGRDHLRIRRGRQVLSILVDVEDSRSAPRITSEMAAAHAEYCAKHAMTPGRMAVPKFGGRLIVDPSQVRCTNIHGVETTLQALLDTPVDPRLTPQDLDDLALEVCAGALAGAGWVIVATGIDDAGESYIMAELDGRALSWRVVGSMASPAVDHQGAIVVRFTALGGNPVPERGDALLPEIRFHPTGPDTEH